MESFWPLDLSEKQEKIDVWLKEIAPSLKLYRTFGKNPGPPRWEVFQSLYRKELENKHASIKLRLGKNRDGVVTLVHNAHDSDRNAAVVLKQFLDESE